MWAKTDDVLTVLDDKFQSADFNYFQTRETGFYPRPQNLLDPTLYPWGFWSDMYMTEPELVEMPNRYEYIMTLPLVVMVFADAGDPRSLDVSDGTNTTKGLNDIAQDINTYIWQVLGPFGDMGVEGVQSWTIDKQPLDGNQEELIRRMNQHPLFRVCQFTFRVTIHETVV